MTLQWDWMRKNKNYFDNADALLSYVQLGPLILTLASHLLELGRAAFHLPELCVSSGYIRGRDGRLTAVMTCSREGVDMFSNEGHQWSPECSPEWYLINYINIGLINYMWMSYDDMWNNYRLMAICEYWLIKLNIWIRLFN